MGRVQPFHSGRIPLSLAFLLIAFLSLASLPAPGPVLLVRVDWRNLEELARVHGTNADVRYCARGYALLSVQDAELQDLDELGLQVSVLDTCATGKTHCIAQIKPGFEERVARLGKRVLCDAEQRVVLALEVSEPELQPALESLAPWCYFLYPLPHGVSLAGWLPDPSAEKPSYALERSPLVSAMLESVSVARIHHDLARLVYYDIARTDGRFNNDLVNLRTRYARHPDCRDSAAAYIVAELSKALGEDAVALVEFRHTPDEVPMYNIVGVLEGTDPDAGYYILGGHYDSIASRSANPDSTAWDWKTDPAPGADDNGTAVACALEAARILADVALPFDVRFVFFSGEELHFWGSQAYVEEAARNADPIIAILNLDMVGYNNRCDKLDIVAIPGSKCVMRTMGEMNALYDIGLLLFEKYDSGLPSSDHWVFWGHGYKGIWATEHAPPWEDDPEGLYRKNSFYHTYNDVVDSLNFSLIRKTAQLCVATLAHSGVGASLPECSVERGPLFEVFAFPNPSSGLQVFFHYQLSEVADVRIEVFTSMGQQVWSRDFYAGKEGAKMGGSGNEVSWPCTNLNREPLASGLYLYKITAFEERAPEASHFVFGKLAIAR